MSRRNLAICSCLLIFVPRIAFGALEWYEHYLQARDRYMRTSRYDSALHSLKEAIRLRPRSALGEQTYGLQFVDYLPYYYSGLCYLKLGDYKNAVTSFDKETDLGLIRQRQNLFHDLQLHRQEAQSELDRLERQHLVQLAREQVNSHLVRSVELEKAARFNEALTLLAQAEQVASALDSLSQRLVADRIAHLRALKADHEQRSSRQQRIESSNDEGFRLLDNDRDQDAIVRFNEVLDLDPRNQRAMNGKQTASAHILARTTRQQRTASYERGKALFESNRYEEALPLLTEAATDSSNNEAAELLKRAQSIVARLRRQRDIKLEIDRRMSTGERLFVAGKYASAQVQFESVLELDPTHALARERAAQSEQLSERSLFEKIRPNQSPVLTIFQPTASDLEYSDATASVEGVATDDRGLAKLEIFLGGKLFADQTPPPRIGDGEPQRHLSFKRVLPLAPGVNEIRVRVVDVLGVSQEQSYRIARRLRFYEKRAFLPASLFSALFILTVALIVVRWRRKRAFVTRFNPYIAGAPVLDDHMFFGRQKIIERILSLLPHNSMMITGERRIGKTSLLYHLKRTLETDATGDYHFVPVFIDLQGIPESRLFGALINDIVDALSAGPELLSELRFRRDQEQFDDRDFSHDLRLLIQELQRRNVKPVRLTLLIDEVDSLNDYTDRTNQQFRSIFMKNFSENLVAVMAGVNLKRGWRGAGSPWYNFFEQIGLSTLTPDEARNLIRSPVSGVFRYENEAVERILQASELKPYLIQKLCIQSINSMLDKGRMTVTVEDVDSAQEQIQSIRESDSSDQPEQPIFMAN